MTHRLRLLVLLSLLFVALLSSAAETRAETVVLTGGTVVTELLSPQARIQGVSGDDFLLNSGTLGPYTSANCTTSQPCAPGQVVSFGRTVAVQFMGSPATALLSGTQFTNLALHGTTLNFITSPFTLDNLPPSSTSYMLTVPFSMTGTVVASGFVNGQSDGQTLFTVDVTGSGLATMRIFQNGSSVFITSVTYEFQQQPVPEPATLVLLGTGAVGLAARLRRRRART